MRNIFGWVLLVVVGFFCSISAMAQNIDNFSQNVEREKSNRQSILDDSTKLVYDASTIQYTTLKDVKFDQKRWYSIDTTLQRVRLWGTREANDYLVQNLGNPGTAVRPIYFVMPDQIGKNSGFQNYDLYFNDHNSIKYYDTKSPVTSIDLVLGSQTRSILDVGFTRNVNPRWNVGLKFTHYSIDKILDRAGKNDFNVLNYQLQFFTNYTSQNNKYKALFNFTRFDHKVFEQGGIINEDSLFYLNEQAPVYLTQAQSQDMRFNYHLYHQYELANGFTAYHEADILSQTNTFSDDDWTVDSLFIKYKYPPIFDERMTNELSRFNSVSNEVGLKGNWKNWYVLAYFRRRDTFFETKYISGLQSRGENYLGGYMRLDLDSLSNVELKAEFNQFGDHILYGKYTHKLFDVSYNRTQFAVPYLYEDYLSNHHSWSNNFRANQADQIKGAIKLSLWNNNLRLKPHFTFTNVFDFVYLDENGNPQQSGAPAQMISPGFDLKLRFFKYLNFETSIIYSVVTGGSRDIFRIPDLYTNTRFYFANNIFGGKINFQGGLDLHYTSEYYAYDYDPTTQQFILQNNQLVENFPVLDAYISFTISTLTAYIKATNILQSQGEGYFVTPYYTGPKTGIDIGFRWYFFD
ncbi:putative porin [Aureibacter tunicatorum]|uniref:Porin n=1 Tax=Aureibacter tunicatorum TaxID=866807 RepID=A0AAE3XMB6_9BACT|nr:putative porin [Aureibacter tunicatorum]MDR6239077.1 hypothetical protein [Aureibacter tunicatorum]BDD04997.1 hypothetical protein AUTU_24800 [Aureibacter tunicatorum]